MFNIATNNGQNSIVGIIVNDNAYDSPTAAPVQPVLDEYSPPETNVFLKKTVILPETTTGRFVSSTKLKKWEIFS